MTSRLNKIILLLILSISFSHYSIGQTLSHFKLGDEQFSYTDIYSILKTKDSQLYVSTDDGVYEFKYNKFQRLKDAKNQKGSSIFNLKTNQKGEIFCHNLNGQIFIIKDSALHLYHETLQNERVNQPEFFFDEDDNILVFSKDLYRLNKDKSVDILFKNRSTEIKKKRAFIRPMQMPDGTIISTFSTMNSQEFLVYKEKKIHISKYSDLNWANNEKRISGAVSAFKFNGKNIYRTEENDFTNEFPVIINKNNNERLEQLNDSLLIAIDFKKGINFWKFSNGILKQQKKVFPNTFISCYHYSENGNLLLGTFGEGILVVPNINSLEIEAISSLRGITTSNGKIYAGSRDGSLFEYSDSLQKIDERKRNIDEVFGLQNRYNYLPEPNLVVSFGSLDRAAIIKDVSEAESGFFFVSNSGVMYSSYSKSNEEIAHFNSTPQANQNVFGILRDQRYTRVAYNKRKKEIYFSNHNSVHYIQGKSIPQELLFQGKAIKCSDLEMKENQLFIATPQNGILIYENHEFKRQISRIHGLNSIKVEKIEIVDNHLYVLTENGFQVINLDNFKTTTLTTQNGVIDNLVSSFTVDNNNLWVLKSSSFYNVPLKSISFEPQELKFTIDSVTVDKKNFKNSDHISLNSTQQNFSLHIDFKDFIIARNAQIEYQLDKEDWQTFPVTQNKLVIQNYGYGEHQLKIRLRYTGETSVVKTINFTMLAPFYLRWWFYPTLLLIVAGIIILFFRRKLRLQAKEARRVNELNSSKLTAIQSQMNPHFVFNALNSIQHLVISGDSDNAYSYITRFANLIRRTLDYSDKERISIFQELELLKVYLELEKLRFKDDFEYTLEKKNIRDVQIPPMLIQPFIENALVHGLLHKEGFKELRIYIELFDDYLLCKVEDNGIGRTEAKKIRQRQRGDHKSFAINAIKNRFRILNEYSNQKLGYAYDDMPPDNGGVVTRVTLKIPIK